ncbi:chemotaxis protein CheB [Spirillospora sp. NPDC047279]|uniref:chemotaxis protein CheB n=1 Tax=Spirillospora sp. NPDC047279 TaxID=3155478 RepID=UPI0033CF0582
MDKAPGRDLVVIAASAGGIEALRSVASGLPPDLAAVVLAVLHVPATGGKALPHILGRAGPLPAVTARDGETLCRGRIYLAPPDHHLLVAGDLARTSKGPRLRGHRPAADPLFRSAAATAGPRVVAVVLSGALADGAAGCAAVEEGGGVVAVQDPAQCAYDGMPRAALAATRRAVTLPLRDMARFITEQTRTPVETPSTGAVFDAESFLRP